MPSSQATSNKGPGRQGSRKPTGRPLLLNEESERKILAALRVGAYRSQAAEAAGIHARTLAYWLEQGEADEENDKDSLFRRLFREVKKTEAGSDVELLALIRKAADASWQAAAWRLERKHPDLFGRRERVDVEHSGQVKNEVTVELVPDEEHRAEVARTLAAAGLADDGDCD